MSRQSALASTLMTAPWKAGYAARMAGDAVALALFAPLGLVSHREGITLLGIGRNAGPLLLGWFLAAGLLRTYSIGGRGRTVATWLLGVTAGVVLRGVLLDRSLGEGQVAFLLVSLAVTGALLGAWRGMLSRSASGAPPRPAEQAD
jgi:hypothetical protein